MSAGKDPDATGTTTGLGSRLRCMAANMKRSGPTKPLFIPAYNPRTVDHVAGNE